MDGTSEILVNSQIDSSIPAKMASREEIEKLKNAEKMLKEAQQHLADARAEGEQIKRNNSHWFW